MDHGDFIPLVPDDLDPEDSATPFCETDCFTPFGNYEDLPSSEYMPLMPKLVGEKSREEDADHLSAASILDGAQPSFPGLCSPEDQGKSDLVDIYYCQYVKGLYSDAPNNKSGVFSRLKFTSKVQEAEYNTMVSMHNTEARKESSTTADKSIEDIMAELQQSCDYWKKQGRTSKSSKVQNEVAEEKRKNVFSRLSWGNQNLQQQQ